MGIAHMSKKQASAGSDSDFIYIRCKVIIWTNAGLLLNGLLETNTQFTTMSMQENAS